jgi:multidrug efflux pump subunit AcrA (membrane-fusion protein)
MKRRVQAAHTVALIVILMVFGLSGCQRIKDAYSKMGNSGGPGGPPAAPVFAVNTMIASPGSIRDYLALSGDIVAASAVDAYSDAAGKISKISVAVGSRVSKGDPIAEVDPSRPGMDFVASVVKAPVSGTIVALPAQLGMTVSQQVPLARIAGGGSGLEIRLYAAERFISRIGLGQNCEITLDAWPGEIFQGRISEVSPVVDPSSRTMEIRVSVDNRNSRLKAGMFAKVKIITEQKDGVVRLPQAAMIQRFGEDDVFITEELPPGENGEEAASPGPKQYAAKKRLVTPGILIDGILEISQGISPGEEVIIRGQTLLEDGSRINIIDRSAPIN